MSIAVGTRMLIHGADIAIEQERLAWTARRQLEKEVEEDKATGKGLDATRELRPSMIAIAAASHALDALYGELRDLALPLELSEKWRANPRSGLPRRRKLLETPQARVLDSRAEVAGQTRRRLRPSRRSRSPRDDLSRV